MPSSSAAANALFAGARVEPAARGRFNHGQRDADQLGAFLGHESTRELKLGVQQWDSLEAITSERLGFRPDGNKPI